MDGADLVVDIDGATLRVPFKNVASVSPAANDESKQAAELLIKGLESQLLSDRESKDVGILAEAFRLAPEDPRVAFWYARSLASAGFGKGASEVFEPRKEAIVAAYPGLADRLAKEIEERRAIEQLPAALVKRLDQIAAAAEGANQFGAEQTMYAAYFRLVDQADEPVGRSAFRINCSGQDENLESFGEGYHLFTFNRRNGFGNNPCQLVLTKPELVSDDVEFGGSPYGAENVGVLRVKRLSDADRREVVVHVVDPEGKPLSGATVSLNSISRSGGHEAGPPVTTAADGVAKLQLFPGEYSCQISLQNYSPSSQRVVVPADAKQATSVDVKLFQAITAEIKVEWRSKSMIQPGMPQFQNDAVTTGQFEQQIGPGRPGGMIMGRFGPPWVRLVQDGDEVQLQFTEQMNFPQAEVSWVGVWKREAEAASASRTVDQSAVDVEEFDMLDLAQLGSIREQLQLKEINLGGMPGRGAPASVPVEAGDIYLGKINSRDPQTGQPASIEFKILATELKQP